MANKRNISNKQIGAMTFVTILLLSIAYQFVFNLGYEEGRWVGYHEAEKVVNSRWEKDIEDCLNNALPWDYLSFINSEGVVVKITCEEWKEREIDWVFPTLEDWNYYYSDAPVLNSVVEEEV